MGEVYRAEIDNPRRPVAVKRIAEHLINDENVVKRFEARLRQLPALIVRMFWVSMNSKNLKTPKARLIGC